METYEQKDWKYYLGHAVAAVGTSFELKPGEPVEMEVLIGEIPGERFCCISLIEDEDADYDENKNGMPILPVLRQRKSQIELKIKLNTP